MVDFITHTVGWKYARRYDALSYEVAKLWTNADEKEEANQRLEHGSVEELRQFVAVDPKLNVLIVHDWDDLSCPFMASVLIVHQMPILGDPNRVQVKEYAGGHMFYSRESSRAAFRRDAMLIHTTHCFVRALAQRAMQSPSASRRPFSTALRPCECSHSRSSDRRVIPHPGLRAPPAPSPP